MPIFAFVHGSLYLRNLKMTYYNNLIFILSFNYNSRKSIYYNDNGGIYSGKLKDTYLYALQSSAPEFKYQYLLS